MKFRIMGTVAVLLVVMLFSGCSGNAAQDESDAMGVLGNLMMLQSNASQEEVLVEDLTQTEGEQYHLKYQ
ncbi:hypothetical protein KAR48_20340 [bacterium]|nr:hypothetical protein [bacterium]